jgi:NAD(P)H-nitrite reductase large subunit
MSPRKLQPYFAFGVLIRSKNLSQPIELVFRNGIRLHSNAWVTAIDRERCQVLAGDKLCPCDRLVIATGSRRSFRMDGPAEFGLIQRGVFLFRTLRCDGIIKFAGRCRRPLSLAVDFLTGEARGC